MHIHVHVCYTERDQKFQSQLNEMEHEMGELKPHLSTVERREFKGQEEIRAVESQGVRSIVMNYH